MEKTISHQFVSTKEWADRVDAYCIKMGIDKSNLIRFVISKHISEEEK